MSTSVLGQELSRETIVADFDRKRPIACRHEARGNQRPKYERDQQKADDQLTLAPCKQPGSHRPLDLFGLAAFNCNPTGWIGLQSISNSFETDRRAITGSSGCSCTSATPSGADSISDLRRET